MECACRSFLFFLELSIGSRKALTVETPHEATSCRVKNKEQVGLKYYGRVLKDVETDQNTSQDLCTYVGYDRFSLGDQMVDIERIVLF